MSRAESLDPTPEVSVVIPTYNRAELLVKTLDSFVGQSMSVDRFEVIVADDGSSDNTREVVESYADRLNIQYFFQEDLGFRAGTARNNGVRLAGAPVIVFTDTGVRVGPDYLAEHLAAHAVPGRLVVGYAYGYRPKLHNTELIDMLDELPPQEVFNRLRTKWSFWDARHPDFARVRFDFDKIQVPWLYAWTLNLSVRRADFWKVGGFDEDYKGWGVEDVDLAYRMFTKGYRLTLSRKAWAIETPHDRDHAGNSVSGLRNIQRFYHKHPTLTVEMYCANYIRPNPTPLEDEYVQLLAWRWKTRELDVTDEVLAAVRSAGAGPNVLVLGAGAGSSQWPAHWTLYDFDEDLIGRAVDAGRPPVTHALGMATPFEDGVFDLVVLTSRMQGLLHTWGDALIHEAHRLAGEVWLKTEDSEGLVRDERDELPYGSSS
ncbi:MAG TPA: glycosyltransferase [Actinocrinis sp.]|nr:glycosyltransferase [Actinocrinis sp.]